MSGTAAQSASQPSTASPARTQESASLGTSVSDSSKAIFASLPTVASTPSPDVVTTIDRGTLRVYRSTALSNLRPYLSPASLYSCRIAAFNNDKLFVATNNRIFSVHLEYPQSTEGSDVEKNHEGYKLPLPISVDAIRDSPAQETPFTKYEIQNLVLQNNACSISGLPSRLAAVDRFASIFFLSS